MQESEPVRADPIPFERGSKGKLVASFGKSRTGLTALLTRLQDGGLGDGGRSRSGCCAAAGRCP